MKERIVISSGYFDPVHAGHIEHFKLAKQLGDKLIVILNNDQQAVLKKGRSFMPQDQRKMIIENLKMVDEVFISIDTDLSVCKSLEYLAKAHPDAEIIFPKGGDRTYSEIPEREICDRMKIKVIDHVGTSFLEVHSSVLTGIEEVNKKK